MNRFIPATQHQSHAKADDLDVGLWPCPPTHIPVARMTISGTWRRHSPPSRDLESALTKTWHCLAYTAIIAATLAAFSLLGATDYLCGLVVQKVQHFQQAPSDVSSLRAHP